MCDQSDWETLASSSFSGDSNNVFAVDGFSMPEQDSSHSPPTNVDQSSKGGIRVSLACVPCRSRHVKCGAETPVCNRCQQDDKPCFYAKSRRGMRDRSTPLKRASSRRKLETAGSQSAARGNGALDPGTSSSNKSYSINSSDGPDSPGSSARLGSKPPNSKRLIDLFYSYFHNAHPFLLPKYYFLSRWQADSDSLQHVVPVMQYIGSLYAPDIDSCEARKLAMDQLNLSIMPPNGFTVQALLLAAIATHAEDKFDDARVFLDRAIHLALDLGMNSRAFATMERDPVLAESWRRTYWLMYVTDSNFAGIRRALSFSMYAFESTVELPCEECDFDGVIPRPKTLEDYEARDFEEETHIFSSFTYLIDLTRITGYILGLEAVPLNQMDDAVTNADAMLVNWQLHLPREKQSVVDKNEEIDEILFQAQNTLQLLLVFIHRPLSRLYHSSLEGTSACAPPPLPRETTGEEDRTYWLHTKKTLEAAEALIALYALPCEIIRHTPTGICSVSMATLANLSACAWLLKGAEWSRTRDRIRLGLGALKAFGEIWSTSRRTERETKAIARGVFDHPRPGTEVRVVAAVEAGFGAFEGGSQTFIEPWQDLGDLEYFGSWDDGSMNTCH